MNKNPFLIKIIILLPFTCKQLICDVILISMVYSNDGVNDPFIAGDPSLVTLDKAWSSLVGVLLNLIGCGIGHWCLKWRPNDDYDWLIPNIWIL